MTIELHPCALCDTWAHSYINIDQAKVCAECVNRAHAELTANRPAACRYWTRDGDKWRASRTWTEGARLVYAAVKQHLLEEIEKRRPTPKAPPPSSGGAPHRSSRG